MLHSFASQLLVLDFDRDTHISSEREGGVPWREVVRNRKEE